MDGVTVTTGDAFNLLDAEPGVACCSEPFIEFNLRDAGLGVLVPWSESFPKCALVTGEPCNVATNGALMGALFSSDWTLCGLGNLVVTGEFSDTLTFYG